MSRSNRRSGSSVSKSLLHEQPIAPGSGRVTDYPTQQHIQALAADQPFGLRFWLAWVAAVTIGWAVGWVVGEVVSPASAVAVGAAILFQGAHVVGIGAAALQALVLRRRLEQPAWWILATGVAAVISRVVQSFVTGSVYDLSGEIDAAVITSIAASVFSSGLLVGAAQWLILRRLVERAGWWIPVSGFGLILAWFLGSIVGSIMVQNILDSPNDLKTFDLIAGLISAIIYAAITGYALARLFRSPRS